MKIVNCKLKIIKVTIFFVVIVAVSLSAYAQGLVPCTGINCKLCDLFSLVQNIFNFVVWTLVPIVATAIILWAGFDMITAGGNQNKAGAGRKRLTAVMIGIAIVYSSYILASFVVKFLAGDNSTANSSFKSGQFEISCSGGEIRDVTGDYLKDGSFNLKIGEDLAFNEEPTAIQPLAVAEGDILGIKIADGDVDLMGLRLDVQSKLANAGQTATGFNSGIEILVTSGARSLQDQEILVSQNCPDGATSSKQCSPETCIPKGNGSNCRHIDGQAVDAWCWQNGRKCSQASFFNNIMKPNGFCVLKSESWHFELKSNLEKNPDRLAAFNCGVSN